MMKPFLEPSGVPTTVKLRQDMVAIMGRSDVKLIMVGPVSHVRYLTHGESSSIVIVVMSTYIIRNPLSRSGRVGKGDLSPGVPMRVRRRGGIAHGPGHGEYASEVVTNIPVI